MNMASVPLLASPISTMEPTVSEPRTHPAPIHTAHVRTASLVTPASPTRPGPPVTRAQPNGESISRPLFAEAPHSRETPIVVDPTEPATIQQAAQIAANAPEPVPIVVIDPEVARKQHELEVKEAKAIEKAKEAEREKANRLIKTMDNEDLNALIRSAQKLVRHVHVAPPAYGDHPEDHLDLNPSEDEEFTLDKLRSHLERFYSSIIFGSLRAGKEIIRLRRWEDRKRTGIALAVYAVAWWEGMILATLFAFLSVLVLVPESRQHCFGPASHHVDTTSDPTVGNSVVILDQPHSSWGASASEDKAAAWADQIQKVIISLTAPGGASAVASGGSGSGGGMGQISQQVQGSLINDIRKQEKNESAEEGMSKKDMAIELYGKPIMKVVGGLADKWERIANAIEPTPPFVNPSRNRVFYTLLLPAIIGTAILTSTMIVKGIGAGIGFGMFGKPVIDRTLQELNDKFPHWWQDLLLKHNILADVPTNPQLILRLRRDAEHKRRPIPNPEMAIDDEEKDANDSSDESDISSDEESEGESDGESKKSGKAKLLGGIKKLGHIGHKVKDKTQTKMRKTLHKFEHNKEEGFAVVSGRKKVDAESKAKNIMDKLHISHDSKPAAKLLDKLPSGTDIDSPDDPSRFYVKDAKHGPGHLIIYPPTVGAAFVPARIAITTQRNVPTDEIVAIDPDQRGPSELDPRTKSKGEKGELVISINDIVAMKKTGLSKIAKVAVEYALNLEDSSMGLELTIIRREPKEVYTGLGHIVNPESGEMDTVPLKGKEFISREEVIELKSIPRRDELFDRLLALGEQRWELL